MPASSAVFQGWASATITRVAASASSVQLLAANSKRRHFFVHNNSTQVLFLSLGNTASLTAGSEVFTTHMNPNETFEWESPFGGYTGTVHGIWAAADASGEALMTEVTL